MCLGLSAGPQGARVNDLGGSAKIALRMLNMIFRWVAYRLQVAFTWTSLQLNYNTVSAPHADSGNVGLSIMLVLCPSGGGEFVLGADPPLQLHAQAILFDGREVHSSLPHLGDRWSIVAFTHYKVHDCEPLHAALRNLSFQLDPLQLPHTPSKRRLFLDVCSGKTAPLTHAVLDAGGACVQPWDAHQACMGMFGDLLHDGRKELLHALADSGAIAFVAAAPPCSDYSVLRLLPAGPPPCRTAEHLHGWPGMSDKLYEQMQNSYLLHAAIVEVVLRVYRAGGHFSWENPPSSLALRESFVRDMVSDAHCQLVFAPACKYGKPWPKTWLFITSWPPLHALGGVCKHYAHPPITGRDSNGRFFSKETAEYPPDLASAFAQCVLPLLDTDTYSLLDVWSALDVPPEKQSFRSGTLDCMPHDCVDVKRGKDGTSFPACWGNPFKVSVHGREQCLRKYAALLHASKVPLGPLMGKSLSCSCKCTDHCHADILADAVNASLRPPAPCTTPAAVRCADGGGLPSTGDWSTPDAKTDFLHDLRKRLLHVVEKHGVVQRVLQHASSPTRDCPLPEDLQTIVVDTVAAWCREQSRPGSCEICPGQPFRLGLLHDLLSLCHDPDVALPAQLAAGVPTGCVSPIRASGIWRECGVTPSEPEFVECEGNWASASVDPSVTRKLVEDEVRDGFVQKFHGNLHDARVKWPKGVAVGKLGVAYAEGRDPRLVLDSTIPGVNPACKIMEKTFNPQLHDLEPLCKSKEPLCALTLDVSKAHKRVKVDPSEHGLLLFQLEGVLYHYTVCHFGGTFSAYWWARVASCMHRTLHKLVWAAHYGFIYVDDWFWALVSKVAPLHASLIICLLVALNCPMSWHKMSLSTCPTWIGFAFNLTEYTVGMPKSKQERIRTFLHAVASSAKMPRKDMEKGVGLLLWASQAFKHLRPWLSEFYHALRCSCPTLQGLSPAQVQKLPTLLDESMRCIRNEAHMPCRKQWQLLSIGANTSPCKANLHACVNPMGTTWSRWADPESKNIQVHEDVRLAARIWSQALPLAAWKGSFQARDWAPGQAAADACASGDSVGLGGWFTLHDSDPMSSAFWFSMEFRVSDMPSAWNMRSEAQRDIGTYELLAQIALFVCRVRFLPAPSQWCLHAFSDNTPAEGAACKLFTTARPLKHAVQCLAAWASFFDSHLHVSHVPGAKNDLADALSRRDTARCQSLLASREIRVDLEGLCMVDTAVPLHPPNAPLASSCRALLQRPTRGGIREGPLHQAPTGYAGG